VTIAHPHLLAARERLTAAITPVAAAPHRHPNSNRWHLFEHTSCFQAVLQMYETPFRHHSNLAPPAASAHCVNMLDHQRGKSVASGIMISTLLICVAQQSIVAQPLGTFSVTGAMTTLRFQHSATLLMDGRVLLAGGYGSAAKDWPALKFTTRRTGAFSPTGGMTSPRRMHSATLLPDGRVLIVGGYSSANALGSAELYDPASSTFIPTGSLTWPRVGIRQFCLLSGKVLILGGYGGSAAAPGFPNVAPLNSTILQPGCLRPLAGMPAPEGVIFVLPPCCWPTAEPCSTPIPAPALTIPVPACLARPVVCSPSNPRLPYS